MVKMCNRCDENKAVADWGVCGDCFAEETDEMLKRVLGDDYKET